MELKIGMQHAPREVVLETTMTADELRAELDQAMLDPNGAVSLHDTNGRHVMVFVHKIAYIEISEETDRRVGFGTL